MRIRLELHSGSPYGVTFCAVALLVSCSAPTKSAPDGSVDGGVSDAGAAIPMDGGAAASPDAGDAGPPVDAGVLDGGTDAGTDDAGSSDAGAGDGGAADASFLGMGDMGAACCNQVACDESCAAQGLLCSNSCVCFHFLGPSQCAVTGCPRGSACSQSVPSACEYDAGALAQPSCSSTDGGFSLSWDGGLCCDMSACKIACGESHCSNSCGCATSTNATTGNIPCTSDAVCPQGEVCYNAFDAGESCIPGTSRSQLSACPTYACDPRFNPSCPTFETCGVGDYCQ